MIWTVEQISQAERIYARMFVDDVTIAQANGDVTAAVRDQMFRNMAGVAHTFGLEVHPGDLEFREGPADTDEGDPQFTTRIEARWRPTTKEVELQGGPGDGQVMALRDAGRPGSSVKLAVTANLGDQPESTSLSYTLTGWDETARRWVYRPDA